MWVTKFKPFILGETVGECVAYYSSGNNTQTLLDTLETLQGTHSLTNNNTSAMQAIEEQLFVYRSSVNLDITDTVTDFQQKAEDALANYQSMQTNFSTEQNNINNNLNN